MTTPAHVSLVTRGRIVLLSLMVKNTLSYERIYYFLIIVITTVIIIIIIILIIIIIIIIIILLTF